MKTLLTMLRKEFRQFFRSAFLPKLCIMFPLVVMLVMPLVTNMDVEHVGVALIDHDHSRFSRLAASQLNASKYLELRHTCQTYPEALALLEAGDVDVILEIPYRFSDRYDSPNPATLYVGANAVNATKGTLGLQYVQTMVSEAMGQELGIKAVPSVKVSTLNMFNPTQNYKLYMIPALMIMLLVMLCGFLPALNIVGEKERGTIEQINVSPISQLSFTMGKVVPYWIIGFIVLTLAMLVGWVVYGLSPWKSPGAVYLASGLFIVVMSSMAVIFANFSDNMQQVMFVMFFFVMVFILMSGLMTPIASMPTWAQRVTYAIPPRYYVDIMRSSYLRGASITDQWPSFMALASFAIGFTAIAILTYRKQS